MSVGGRWWYSTLEFKKQHVRLYVIFFCVRKNVRIYVSWSYSMSDLLENSYNPFHWVCARAPQQACFGVLRGTRAQTQGKS